MELALRVVLEHLDYVVLEGVLVFFRAEQLVVFLAVCMDVLEFPVEQGLHIAWLGIENVAKGVDVVSAGTVHPGFTVYVTIDAQP